MIEVVTEEMHGSEPDSDLKLDYERALVGMALISTSEMALISEWMEQCGKKALDDAGMVREA